MPGPISFSPTPAIWPTSEHESTSSDRTRPLRAAGGASLLQGTTGRSSTLNPYKATGGASLLRGTTGQPLPGRPTTGSSTSKPLQYRQTLPPAPRQAVRVTADPGNNTASVTFGKNPNLSVTGGVPGRGEGFLTLGVQAKIGASTTLGLSRTVVGNDVPKTVSASLAQELGGGKAVELNVTLPPSGPEVSAKFKVEI